MGAEGDELLGLCEDLHNLFISEAYSEDMADNVDNKFIRNVGFMAAGVATMYLGLQYVRSDRRAQYGAELQSIPNASLVDEYDLDNRN